MKTLIQKLKEGIFFGIGLLTTITIGVFAYQFTSYQNIPDVGVGSGLTINSFNQLLANVRDLDSRMTSKKGLENAKLLNCFYQNNSAGTVGWKTKTWIASDCGGVNIPNDFTNCIGALNGIDGAGVDRGLARCNKADGRIYLDQFSGNQQVVLSCNYLCWN